MSLVSFYNPLKHQKNKRFSVSRVSKETSGMKWFMAQNYYQHFNRLKFHNLLLKSIRFCWEVLYNSTQYITISFSILGRWFLHSYQQSFMCIWRIATAISTPSIKFKLSFNGLHGLTDICPVLRSIQKLVIRFALQNKLLVSIWIAKVGWNWFI